MIYFLAVTDLNEGGKFHKSVIKPSLCKGEMMWGVTELSTTTFQKISQNDFILFYLQGRIIGIGKVKETKTDRNLSKALWGSKEHKIMGEVLWSNIIVLSDYRQINMPFSEIIALGDYSSKFSIRRVIRMNTKGIEKITSEHRSMSNFINHLTNKYAT
jgi:hypothetical protein